MDHNSSHTKNNKMLSPNDAQAADCPVVSTSHSEAQSEEASKESKDIMRPSSYLIFDTETTDLPGPYGNPRITELCLLGVHREDMFEDGVGVPRVINKLQLCLNPQKIVTPGSSMITGLFNDALERQQPFNSDILSIIRGFIETQAQPTCLIAHNGDKFDFPLLVSELMKVGEELPQDLLCADSLLAFRELDADPEGQSSDVGLKGQQTWNRTEVTPLKRPAPEDNQKVSVLPKKPRKDFNSESLFANIERQKVAKQLLYNDSTNDSPDEKAELGQKTGTKTHSGFQPSNSSTDSDSLCTRLLVEAAEDQTVKESHGKHTSDGLTVESDSLVESKRHHTEQMFSLCSQGSLLDDEFLMAVTQMESGNDSLGLKEKENGQLCDGHPSTSTRKSVIVAPQTVGVGSRTINANPQIVEMKNKTSNAESKTVNVKEETVETDPQTLGGDPLTVDDDPHNLQADPLVGGTDQKTVGIDQQIANADSFIVNSIVLQTETSQTKIEASPSSSASTIALSSSTGFSVSLCDSSPDTVVRPSLNSEATVIYNFEPNNKTGQNVSTELNSQGSLPDCDILAAVQNMERIHDTTPSADGRVLQNGKGKGSSETDGVKVMDINAKNNNSPQEKCMSDTSCPVAGNCESKLQAGNAVLIAGEKINSASSPAKQNQTSNVGKRRSFRLADIYTRHFGHPPCIAHTAEDDCISLLKVVKKFSPKFLDWIDENCVPFRTVKPMY